MAFIDAAGMVYARFYEYEGTIPAMSLLKDYIKEYGIPMSIYSDKHTKYKKADKNKDILPPIEFLVNLHNKTALYIIMHYYIFH